MQISSAVEALELMGQFRNAEKELSTQKTNGDLKAIGEVLVKLENEELLEVCLRKKLLPASQYGWLITKCRNHAVALLPCLIAYKNQKEESINVKKFNMQHK